MVSAVTGFGVSAVFGLGSAVLGFEAIYFILPPRYAWSEVLSLGVTFSKISFKLITFFCAAGGVTRRSTGGVKTLPVPLVASIDVYFKTLRADDTADFDSITFTQMTADTAVSDSKNRTDFREYTFEQSGLDGFIAFAIKIVMRGTSSCEVPNIRDFRTIALAL